jgi:hypothetical protein
MAMTTTRGPLQPLFPRSPNTTTANHDGSNGLDNMKDAGYDDADTLDDDFSLTSKDVDDGFERQMLRNARDEMRLRDASQGRVQAFRKARTHPRVGVTLENLERHNANSNVYVKAESPPSSSASTRSDPAVQPPTAWGRKGRTKRNWMRTITADDEPTTPRPDDEDAPRASVEDSPLSHKASRQHTPVSLRPRADDWDFDFNEASLIASTPYLPRNTALDDIRQREIESLREQGVTKHRLDRLRETSPEDRRRPASASARTATSQQDGTIEPAPGVPGSPERRIRNRTSSWQKMSKSVTTTGEASEHAPITVYRKSTETVGVVNRQLLANAQAGPKRPAHRREDSHDLLRRLARVSSTTPSPGRNATVRPQTAPASQPENFAPNKVLEATPTLPPAEKPPIQNLVNDLFGERTTTAAMDSQSQQAHTDHAPEPQTGEASLQNPQTEDVDVTPFPVERSMLNPKTPVVTGAWVDTPRPVTAARPDKRARSPSKSPKKNSQAEQPAATTSSTSVAQDIQSSSTRIRPTLPGSVLEAVVEHARTDSDHQSGGLGDSTINSLEDLIAPMPDNVDTDNPDEDTLQDLQVPTAAPRNEAERRRQQETLQLHRMNERLRTARTNIRDASRGIRRVENRVEHVDEGLNGQPVKTILRECPCAANGGHQCSEWTVWRGFKSMFYDERLKPRRRGWGLTILSISLIAFFTWLVLENTAWYVFPPPVS